jgi:hypothetical protein
VESRRLLTLGILASLVDDFLASLIGVCKWRELPIVDSCLESPPLVTFLVCVEGFVDEASPILAHVLKLTRPQTFLCFCHRWEGLAEREPPLAILELMTMLPIVVPTILYGSAGSQVDQTIVQSVSVLVVYHGVPVELKTIQVHCDLVQGNATTRNIARIGHAPL